jgi:hypothetical protein
MDDRFSSVRSDNDPRFPSMLVAKVANLRDMAAFTIGAHVEHEGVAMRVVGRDANIGMIRMRPNPTAPARPAGPIHLASGVEDDDRTCGDESTGSLSTNPREVTCGACLDLALAEAERLAVEYTARILALRAA